jgi:hypothetical protein
LTGPEAFFAVVFFAAAIKVNPSHFVPTTRARVKHDRLDGP